MSAGSSVADALERIAAIEARLSVLERLAAQPRCTPQHAYGEWQRAPLFWDRCRWQRTCDACGDVCENDACTCCGQDEQMQWRTAERVFHCDFCGNVCKPSR